MAKRHHLVPGNWESVFGRLEELVLANSGEDEFEEIYKLLIAKVFAERFDDGRIFVVGDSSATLDRVNGLLVEAAARWKGILPNDIRSRLVPEHLSVCAEAIDPFVISDSTLEVLDALFEFLIAKSAKGSKGQYFTPRYVVEACVEMVNPSADETVLDPACGSGGFLLHALRHVAPDGGAEQKRYIGTSLWGFDFDLRATEVAKALMVIVGDAPANIFRVNSLLNPRIEPSLSGGETHSVNDDAGVVIEDLAHTKIRNFRGFDAILTNPPFAGEIQESAVLRSYALARDRGRTERDVLFLERCIDLLRPGGRMAIVLPHNKLGGKAFGYVREWVMRRAQIVAVLGLGRNTFQPHTAQKAGVLFLRKREHPVRVPPRNEPILFLISEQDGKDSRGVLRQAQDAAVASPAWIRVNHDLGEATEAFAKFVANQGIPWGG